MRNNKLATIIGLILITIGLSSCASMKFMKSAEQMWNQGNIVSSLLNATYSLQEDGNNKKAKLFIAQRYEKGIILIEDQISSMAALSEPQRSVKKVEMYTKLIELNQNMNSFIYPFTDKKATYSWKPASIYDYTNHLAQAKKGAADAYLNMALNASDWMGIDTNGKEALRFASETAMQNKIRASITELFYSRSKASYEKNTEADILYALDGFAYTNQWQPAYKETQSLITKCKTALAGIYYKRADELTAESASRSDLKKAISLFSKSIQWVAGYSNSIAKIAELKERLAIYLYCVLDQKSYSYLKGYTPSSSNYPADIRGLYLSQLNKALPSGHNIRFNKKTAEGSLSTVLHPYIMEISAADYGTPLFISAAEKAGVSFLSVIRINSGNEVGQIQITSTKENRQRTISRKRVKITYYDINQMQKTTYSDPPEEIYTLISTIKLIGATTSSKEALYTSFVKYGAQIPANTPYNYYVTTVKDTLDYEVVVERYSYPVTVSAELVSIADKKKVAEASFNYPISGVLTQYMTRTLKNGSYYDPQKDLTRNRVVSVTVDDSLITTKVLTDIFSRINKKIVPYIQQVD